MPVRSPPITDRAARLFFEGIVDYAGLYPPASVSMLTAVRNYANYRGSGAAWLLGRFVCPANSLAIFSQQADVFLPRDAGAIPWRLAAVGSGDIVADLEAISAFNERHRVCFDEVGAIVDAYEVKATSVADIDRLDAAISPELTTYIEVPLTGDLDPLVAAIAHIGRRAKMRTGGVTPEAFPSGESVVRFLSACIALDVPAKATAGLHHPMCGAYRLTYEERPPVGQMFGFLNVFLAAAHVAAGGSHDDALLLLSEQNPGTLELNEHSIVWRGANGVRHFDRALLQRVRESVLVSFGSCSFTEPVDETRRLGFV